MTDYYKNLEKLGITLPIAVSPVANYIAYKIIGSTLYISGQLPMEGGKIKYLGLCPDKVSNADAVNAARLCAINVLAQAEAALEDLNKIKSCLKIGVFIACGAEFVDHPNVANGASNLIGDVFGSAGKHVRFAVGASSLPLGATVEVEAIFELKA